MVESHVESHVLLEQVRGDLAIEIAEILLHSTQYDRDITTYVYIYYGAVPGNANSRESGIYSLYWKLYRNPKLYQRNIIREPIVVPDGDQLQDYVGSLLNKWYFREVLRLDNDHRLVDELPGSLVKRIKQDELVEYMTSSSGILRCLGKRAARLQNKGRK